MHQGIAWAGAVTLLLMIFMGGCDPERSYTQAGKRTLNPGCNAICDAMEGCEVSERSVEACRETCKLVVLSSECIAEFTGVECDGLQYPFEGSSTCFPPCSVSEPTCTDDTSILVCDMGQQKEIDCGGLCSQQDLTAWSCGSEPPPDVTQSSAPTGEDVCWCVEIVRQ